MNPDLHTDHEPTAGDVPAVLRLDLSAHLLDQIWRHGEAAYPEEGAGLLLGKDAYGQRQVLAILPFGNSRESTARHNRYLITAQDMLRGEQEALRQGLDIVGVFHSHPDHPNQPSEFDRQWALPWYSYIITTVSQGVAQASRCWRLQDDRSQFVEETLAVEK